jgi:hypothetical protein
MTLLAPGGEGSQLDRRVRPVLGDSLPRGQGPGGLAAVGGETRTPLRPLSPPEVRHLGTVSCGLPEPSMTAVSGAVRSFPGAAYPARTSFWSIRSNTPLTLRSPRPGNRIERPGTASWSSRVNEILSLLKEQIDNT